MRKRNPIVFFGILAALIVAGVVISLPPVWSRITYYASQVYTEIFYKINPPQEVVFNPGQSTPDEVGTAVSATLHAILPQTTVTPTPTFQPIPTLAPLPASVLLAGVEPEAQSWNNCGPATLSMNLSFWSWAGNQVDTAEILKPNVRDKNVMPYEMVDYVNEQTNLKAIVRMGGDLYTLKALIAAGFPVLVEKGFEPENLAKEGWMGHYNLVIGYDDTEEVFTTQDSYLLAPLKSEERASAPGFKVTYNDMISNWRAFNNVFIVVYAPEKENDVLNVLGSLADETASYQVAYNRAVQETTSLSDARDRYFAWFNAGTSLVKLQDYSGAAAAYDMAFSIYPTITEKSRPYRMLWYQTGPYYAYYYTARYQDVITLATTTLDAMSEPILEESYHWRAMAELQLGNNPAALGDFREAVSVHPGFLPSIAQLELLGETP
jgi:tetratricopeptide (TPR) repeat protein